MIAGARPHVLPFPFATLEVLTRAEVAMTSRLRRVARDFVDVGAIEDAASELVGERVRITGRGHRRLDSPRGTDDAIGVVLAMPDEHAASRRVLVEVDGMLGAAVTSRALRQRAPRILEPGRAPSPAVAGAFAAVLVAVLRRAHVGAVARVIAAGPGADLARDLLLVERDVTTASLTVVMGGDAFHARVSVPDAFTPAPHDTPLSQEALSAMGDAAIAIPLVATTTFASRRDLAALSPGDAFVPAKLGLRDLQEREPRESRGLAANAAGWLLGPVALLAPRSERGLSADLAADGRLVIRNLLESHPWSSEEIMPSEPSGRSATATIEALEDAPVVVRVELGTVEMKAREWAELGPGDVVTLGRRLGDPAVLRVGGVELARGELVQVDGEYAVRIMARTAAVGDRS